VCSVSRIICSEFHQFRTTIAFFTNFSVSETIVETSVPALVNMAYNVEFETKQAGRS
jgi:hypothetical protein